MLAALIAALLALARRRGARITCRAEFIVASTGEAFAVVRAGCAACDWGEAGP